MLSANDKIRVAIDMLTRQRDMPSDFIVAKVAKLLKLADADVPVDDVPNAIRQILYPTILSRSMNT